MIMAMMVAVVVLVVAMDHPIEDLGMTMVEDMTVKWVGGLVMVMKGLMVALWVAIRTGREDVEVMVMLPTVEILKGMD
jgi:hypothetical protein